MAMMLCLEGSSAAAEDAGCKQGQIRELAGDKAGRQSFRLEAFCFCKFCNLRQRRGRGHDKTNPAGYRAAGDQAAGRHGHCNAKNVTAQHRQHPCTPLERDTGKKQTNMDSGVSGNVSGSIEV
eukprot:1160608-Pelagomonas_calceolata.AAC.8